MKTIEDAVIEVGGKWLSGVGRYLKAKGPANTLDNDFDFGCMSDSSNEYWVYLCTREEFEATAKRMGYINGYKYMEECTEKGKPNLPDDVMVSVMTYGRGRLPASHVGFWNWDSSEIKSFRIVDERYKPVDTSYLNASTQTQSLTHSEEGLTHNWHELGELPPVGTVCEYTLGNSEIWYKCEIHYVVESDGVVMFAPHLNHKQYCSIHGSSGVKFRPIRTERDQFIEQSWDKLRGDTPHKDTTYLLGQLYDLGYRLPVVEK